MELLSTSQQINTQLSKLMDYKEYYWAVAWATTNDQMKTLIRRKKRIQKIIFGTHFYQTHPDVLETFADSEDVRFNFDTSSVFHPKLYLFYNSNNDWACILGSPNFTHAALNRNEEVAVLFTEEDDDDDGTMLASLMDKIDTYWKNAESVGDRYEAYRNHYELSRKKLDKLADIEPESNKPPATHAIDCRIRTLNWNDYYQLIQEDEHHSFDERLAMLETAQQYFTERNHFSDFTVDMRKSVAGVIGATEEHDWGWFGSMKGAGKFVNRINNNDPYISEALDAIPTTGPVSRSHFMDAVSLFKRAFPEGRDGIGVLSRLLTMKRPDTFFCIDSRNKRLICQDIGINQIQPGHYERYWDSLLERMMDTPWWHSPQPNDAGEIRAWHGRMAMLDAIYYEYNQKAYTIE